jgi:hypothetical protein
VRRRAGGVVMGRDINNDDTSWPERPDCALRKCGERGTSTASTTTSEEAQIRKFAPISLSENSVRAD